MKFTPFMQYFVGNLIQLVESKILNNDGDTYYNVYRCILCT